MSGVRRGPSWLDKTRRQLAATAVKGRRRLQRESGLVDLVDTVPVVKDGEVVHAVMVGNAYLRYIIAGIAKMGDKNVVLLALRAGLVIPDEEKPLLRVARG